MKTEDLYFQGFPAVWNLVVFYFFLVPLNAWVVAAVIAALSAATFLPIKFVHPFRVVRLRLLTIALLALWAVLAVVAVLNDLRPAPWVTVGLMRLRGLFPAVRPHPVAPGDAGRAARLSSRRESNDGVRDPRPPHSAVRRYLSTRKSPLARPDPAR